MVSNNCLLYCFVFTPILGVSWSNLTCIFFFQMGRLKPPNPGKLPHEPGPPGHPGPIRTLQDRPWCSGRGLDNVLPLAKRLKGGNGSHLPMTDPWDERHIYLPEWLTFMVNVGKYTKLIPWILLGFVSHAFCCRGSGHKRLRICWGRRLFHLWNLTMILL